MFGWLQPGDGLGLGAEAGQLGRRRRSWPARIILRATSRFEPDLPGLVDDAHAAAADLLQDLVPLDGRQAGGRRSVGDVSARLRSVHDGADGGTGVGTADGGLPWCQVWSRAAEAESVALGPDPELRCSFGVSLIAPFSGSFGCNKCSFFFLRERTVQNSRF